MPLQNESRHGVQLVEAGYAADWTRVSVFLRRWSLYLYLTALLTLCALEVLLGALPTRIYAHDVFIFLDGAWRVAHGQVPTVDFYAGYGVLVWNPLRWGLALRHYRIEGMGAVRAIYTAFLGLWFLLLSRRSPSKLFAAVSGAFFLV